MALPATTRGLQELASLRNRIARDYGLGRMSLLDFEYVNERLVEIETRLIELAACDPKRLELEEEIDKSA
jgi:hypothetical protein